jgi:hypothetical protein
MRIFQVKYNQDNFCYYKAHEIQLFNENTDLFKSYTDCKEGINKIIGYEYFKIRESLLDYFKNKQDE